MAHYAILDENKIVTQVIVGKDENEPLPEGYTSWEQYYGGLRTSYNTAGNQHDADGTPFRANYAMVGGKYDSEFDAFIPIKPFPSWILDYNTFLWMAPIAIPEAEHAFAYKWSESNLEWIKVKVPQAE